jgi:hypothetical protein
LKTKSCKIQRIEFILDKIVGGDRKRKVHFDHPTKKNVLG